MFKTNEYIIIHHTAVSREHSDKQFDAVNNYHKEKGWGQIGYHYFIEPDGEVKKGREDGQVGAHCSQKLMNYRSIGICLTGDFDQEHPTVEQTEALFKLVNDLRRIHGIEYKNVVPHRRYATYKSCPGSNIQDSFIEKVAIGVQTTNKVSEWALDAVKWCKDKKIATDFTFPQGAITKEQMAVMLYRLYNLKK